MASQQQQPPPSPHRQSKRLGFAPGPVPADDKALCGAQPQEVVATSGGGPHHHDRIEKNKVSAEAASAVQVLSTSVKSSQTVAAAETPNATVRSIVVFRTRSATKADVRASVHVGGRQFCAGRFRTSRTADCGGG